MREVSAVTHALADEGRLRILLALRGGELCACQVSELLALAPSTVSKHLALLRQARLIETRKVGRWTFCRPAGDDAPALARQAVDWIAGALSDDKRIAADERKLKELRALGPEVVCRRRKA